METTESREARLDLEHLGFKDHFPGESIAPAAIPLRPAINYAQRTVAKRVSTTAAAKFIAPMRPGQIVIPTVEKNDYDRISIIGAVTDVKVLTATVMLEDH